MAISAELQARIDTEMKGLEEGDFKRSGYTAVTFLDIVLQLLVNAKKDEPALITAGLAPDMVVYFDGLVETMSNVLAMRHGITTETPEQRTFFDEQFKIVERDRKYMLAVVAHIVERSNDKKVKNDYKKITAGSSILDSLNDVRAMSVIIKKYLQFAAEVHPKGMTIDASFCDAADNRALELLRLKNYVIEKGASAISEVELLNRITTLCVRAMGEIKKFAYFAFIDDSDYYGKNYVFAPSTKPQDATIITEPVDVPVKK